MSKKVLIIGTSPRKNGNSNRLAQEFEKGAREAGNDVDVVYLYDKNINFCKGCLACQKLNHCVIDDDANSITEKIHNAEVIVWATPVYYYEMCGQMKTMIDRSNPLYTMDNKFEDIYLLAAAAEPETSAFDGAIKGLQGWIDCHEKAHFKGGNSRPGSRCYWCNRRKSSVKRSLRNGQNYILINKKDNDFFIVLFIWAAVDSNHRPHPYQGCALTT